MLAVLSKLQNILEKVVTYGPRTLSNTKITYSACEKENLIRAWLTRGEIYAYLADNLSSKLTVPHFLSYLVK